MAAKVEFTPLFMYPAHQETVIAEAKFVRPYRSSDDALTFSVFIGVC